MEKNHILKQKAENFVERSNAYIHALLLFLALFVSVVCPIFELQDSAAIIIELLALIFAEILVLQAKDSITQKKLNVIKVNTAIRAGALFRSADFGIDALRVFFDSTCRDFFISGMALNNFIHTNQRNLENLVKSGKKVYILISNLNALEMNMMFLYGNARTAEEKKRWINGMRQCICSTLTTILDSEILAEGVAMGNVYLGLSPSPFTTSFIAHDIVKQTGKSHAIQASFYQYGCTFTLEEPGIMVDSVDGDTWFEKFREAAIKQWEDATIVENVDQIRELLNQAATPV